MLVALFFAPYLTYLTIQGFTIGAAILTIVAWLVLLLLLIGFVSGSNEAFIAWVLTRR